MSETRRSGRWQVPPQLDVVSFMSDTRLDLTHAELASPQTEIHLRVMWSTCRVIVPPGYRVVNEMHAIMAGVRSKADELARPGQPSGPIIRLSGTVMMGEVKVLVRRREDPIPDDDDDDDDDDD